MEFQEKLPENHLNFTKFPLKSRLLLKF